MKNFTDMIKHWDIILILFFIVLSFVPLLIFSFIQVSQSSEHAVYEAAITVNDREVERFRLTDHQGVERLQIPEVDCNPSAIEVQGEQIRIESSTCPEQICVQTGYISKPGKPIVCIPHQVIIEIESIDEEQQEEVIISS
ncbi:NusG domain II-containing protein [Aquibacillus sediminis]|uniref:NusG domain II-containing protein n=1 Tax=Aquibacillus sediminis TaxID=2574734 RepID=UPI001109CD46|nr:NusG domain II-containing protein [Aquibacillus sediminis]